MIYGLFTGLVQAATLNTISSINCQDGSVTLGVAQATVNIPGIVSFTSRLYTYNGVAYYPSPTIRMKSGTSCSITVQNSLSTSSSIASCDYHVNAFHCADTTNLHTHG